MSEINVTRANFESEVLNSDLPVLVDFYATWCGPCKMLAPVLADVATEYAGRVKVGKVNVDEQPELAAMFNVSGVPTLALFKDGALVDTSVGFKPKAGIAAMLGDA